MLATSPVQHSLFAGPDNEDLSVAELEKFLEQEAVTADPTVALRRFEFIEREQLEWFCSFCRYWAPAHDHAHGDTKVHPDGCKRSRPRACATRVRVARYRNIWWDGRVRGAVWRQQ